MSFKLPFDTSRYDDIPISIMIYEPTFRADGSRLDYLVRYANKAFARDWKQIYGNDRYIGAGLVESTLMDDYSFEMMDKFLKEKPHSFSTYMPLVKLHLHFEPMTDLPEPYYGFFLTNITDYEEQEARIHFLRSIQQMQGNTVLMREDENGEMEAVHVSKDFADMMECTVDEARKMMDGKGFIESTDPDDRLAVRRMLRRHESDDGGSTLIVQKTTAKGRHIWCNVHYAFIDDFDEHYVYCTYFDVTVQKEYEERLRGVYTSLGKEFYNMDAATLCLMRVNLTRDSVEDIKGRDLYHTDRIGMPFTSSMRQRMNTFPVETERAQFESIFDRETLISGFSHGKVSASQVLYSKRPDGRMCYVNLEASITRHPLTGDIIAFITEKEYNVEKVRETLIRKILAQQFDMVSYVAEGEYGVVVGDPSRIQGGNIFPITRTGNYSHYLESQVYPVLSGDDEYKQSIREALDLEHIRKQIRIHDPYSVDIAIEMDGQIYYKRFDFFLVDPKAHFSIVLKSDTSELQREQIRRNEQLADALEEARQANVAKTAFLSSMSHEIRTPMNAIIGLDNIALNDPDLPERTREHLEKIGGSAKHLLGLINDILDMSRIESGRMVLKKEEFSFGNFLDQINTMINGQCIDKNLHYDCVIKGTVDNYYIGDDMKLKQVLINILGNSVKFTEAPGTVSFTVEQTASFDEQRTLKFTMADTGIGMDKEYIPKIFEAFSQEDATSTNKYGGSGLGMAITKNIVEMMNGTIEVESEKGVGSTFTVTVTLRASDRTDSLENSKVRPQDMRVLVIDDDPLACEHAKVVMDELGIITDTCLSGREALDLIELHHARREEYNMILVDWKMPEQDGIEVTRDIRNMIGHESAIVILTAYSWDDIVEDAKAAGVDSFMAKPLFAANVMTEFENAIMAKQMAAAKEVKEVDLTGRRILLAEDMQINADIMKMVLEMKGMVAEHAENGQIAVDMFSASEPGYYDAVLMDVRMPVLDGLGATEAIRALQA